MPILICMGSSTLCLSCEGESAMTYFVLAVIDFSDDNEAVEKEKVALFIWVVFVLVADARLGNTYAFK